MIGIQMLNYMRKLIHFLSVSARFSINSRSCYSTINVLYESDFVNFDR